MITEDHIIRWAEKELKPKHNSEKLFPLKRIIEQICEAAILYGEMPKWMVNGVLGSVRGSKGHEYK